MGFWRFNPPEPCCNPPAGFCQCQPCRWKVTDWSGFEQIHNAEFQVDALPVFEGGESSARHSVLRRNDPAITSTGPPWWRLYRAITGTDPEPETVTTAGPEDGSVFAGFWLGYWRWNLDANTPSGTLRDRWGLTFRGTTHAPSKSDVGFFPPRYDFQVATGEIWLHRPELSGRWKCWGENTLHYSSNFAGDSVAVDPDLFVKVAPVV